MISLNLSKNKITHIGLGLLYTPYLRELYLSYNQLSSLDGLINL